MYSSVLSKSPSSKTDDNELMYTFVFASRVSELKIIVEEHTFAALEGHEEGVTSLIVR